MSNTFITTLRDETLRIEVGSTAASDLAVENIELSTPDLSQAVRASVIVRRAASFDRAMTFENRRRAVKSAIPVV